MMTSAAVAKGTTASRIFIVDDNSTVRRSLRTVLEQHDRWTVCEEASNGREAIEKVARVHPDVIVLDLQMPGMNGLEAAKQIRRQFPNTPILMFTIHMSPQLKDEARKVGIRGTCAKTNPACIVQAVEALLHDRTFYSI